MQLAKENGFNFHSGTGAIISRFREVKQNSMLNDSKLVVGDVIVVAFN